MITEAKNVTLTSNQANIHIINANVCHNLWPRGEGKTEGGSGPRIVHLSEVMPRSQVIYYTDTYERIHDRLIPNVANFLKNEMGLIEDEDFVLFKKPPDHFEKPLIPLTKFEHVVSFATGFALCGASAKVEGSCNGYNAQGAIIEETKYVKQMKIKTELYKALRGNLKYFGHLPEYRSVWSFSDKYEGDISWILNLRDKQNPALMKAVLTMALYVIELKRQLDERIMQNASDSTIYKLQREIIAKESRLNAIRKEMVYVCEGKPFANMINLGEKFYRDAKRDCKSIYEYNVAIKNEDPGKAEHGFYPDISEEKHLYDTLDDVDVNESLILAMDFNWRIISCCVAQINQLPGNTFNTLNTVGATHALAPDGIPEAIQNFSNLFPTQQKRKVIYMYDNTAIAKDAGRPALYLLVIKALKANGWRVKPVYINVMPEHSLRYQNTKNYLAEDGEMSIRINKVRAAPTLKSLQKAGARSVSGKTRKDKRPEDDMNYPAQDATHHSEAWDQIMWAVKGMALVKKGEKVLPMMKANT